MTGDEFRILMEGGSLPPFFTDEAMPGPAGEAKGPEEAPRQPAEKPEAAARPQAPEVEEKTEEEGGKNGFPPGM